MTVAMTYSTLCEMLSGALARIGAGNSDDLIDSAEELRAEIRRTVELLKIIPDGMSVGREADQIFDDIMRAAKQQGSEMYIRQLAYHARKKSGSN